MTAKAEIPELLKSLDYSAEGNGHPNTLCGKAASALRTFLDEGERGWMIERHINNRLHFWCAGARGRGSADDWSTDHEWAARFAREEDAMQVLLHICHGEGRVAEHKWVAKAA